MTVDQPRVYESRELGFVESDSQVFALKFNQPFFDVRNSFLRAVN